MPVDKRRVLIIGICGVTCGGKTTLATQLQRIFPRNQLISQDDYFLPVDDVRHVWLPELDHINFDILSSLDMETMYKDVCKSIRNHKSTEIIDKQTLLLHNKQFNNVDDLKGFIQKKVDEINLNVIIIEGFCIFNYKPLLPLFDLKYYFTLDKDECYRRRQTRVYEPPDCEGYFEQCVWPEHLKQLEEVRNSVKNVTYFDQTIEDPLKQVLLDVVELLE